MLAHIGHNLAKNCSITRGATVVPYSYVKMVKKQKPQTPEELAADIENHPDRGKLDGEDVVRFDLEDIRVAISKELYRTLLEVGGAMGLNKKEIFMAALIRFVTDPGVLSMVERSQSLKSEKFGVSRFQIRSKVLGSYKHVARVKSNRMQPDDDLAFPS